MGESPTTRLSLLVRLRTLYLLGKFVFPRDAQSRSTTRR